MPKIKGRRRTERASASQLGSKSNHGGGRTGQFRGVLKNSPIRSYGKRGTSRITTKTRRFTFEDYLRDYKGLGGDHKTASVKPLVQQSELDLLQMKWCAVLELQVARRQAPLTELIWSTVASKYGLTAQSLRRYEKLAFETGDLARKPGSGRPAIISEQVSSEMENIAADFEYDFTQEVMTIVVQQKLGIGSKGTVNKILNGEFWGKHRQRVHPFLTEEHIKARLEWARRFIGFDYENSKEVRIHIDEKNFYAFRASGRVLYCPVGVEPPALYALSKTQIPYVMFLGAVAAPRPLHGFDGKIGLWVVGEEYEAKRPSKFHEKGEVYLKPVTMDGDFFHNMVHHKLLPAINEVITWKGARALVQLDSAGGHSVRINLDKLNALGAKNKVKTRFETQPTRSPDNNVLDLGLWNSMQSRMATVKYDKRATESMHHRIIDAVFEMWTSFPAETITKVFKTLSLVHQCIIDSDGGNSFKMPHSNKSDDMEIDD